MAEPDPPLTRTPGIEALLSSLRRKILVLVVVHGIGTLCAALTAWLAFAYLADWALRVPRPVRIFHGLVVLGVFAYFLWREFLRPLRSMPDRTGLALLAERANPSLRELLVSAVQFQAAPGGRRPDGAPPLVDEVLAQAERAAAGVDLAPILDRETPRARFVLGTLGTAAVVAFACLRPTEAGIFLDHLLGGERPWPRRTRLLVEVPPIEGATIVESSDERLHLRVARGTDVPVRILAEGVAPEEVLLSLEGREDVPLSRGGGNTYRTLLRALQEDVVFWATGGDDQDDVPRVEIDVLQPPDVEGLAIEVRPPEYSHVAPSLVFEGETEVLQGSELVIHALPSPPAARGKIRLLPEDALAELVPTPFPNDPGLGDGVAPRIGLSHTLRAEASFGYRIELVDETGLSNPDPGLHRVLVREDQAPEVELAAPARTEVEVVPEGALPLRVFARDDLGVLALEWRVRDAEAAPEAPPVLEGSLPVPGEVPSTGGAPRPPRLARGAERLEVASLGGPGGPGGSAPVAVDKSFVLEVVARDERQPTANEGRATPVRVRVVSHETLLRRLQERLGRARMDAIALSELQREKRARLVDLVAALEADGRTSAEAQAKNALLSGQRRVLSDAQALLGALAETAEEVLYARIDDKAHGLLLAHDERMRALDPKGFPSAPWRELVRSVQEERGSGLALGMIRLVGLSLAIAEDDALAAVAALEEAERATDRGATLDALARAEAFQASALEHIEGLLEELKAWDNFQNVLSLLRDVLARQKNLRERTQRFASQK
jgi:hypothetical protein